jgi:hypothetical protein
MADPKGSNYNVQSANLLDQADPASATIEPFLRLRQLREDVGTIDETGHVDFNVSSGDGDTATIRITEGDTRDMQGGYIKHDGSSNTLSIGVHHTDDSTAGNDVDAIVIDRATGNVTINGTTTTVNSTTLTVDDINIELAHSPSGSALNDAGVDGGGITLKSSDGDKTIAWQNALDAWLFNQGINTTGKLAIGLSTAPGAYNDSADNLVIYETGNSGITIAGTPADWGCIFFADATTGEGSHAGSMSYNHATDKLHLGTAGSDYRVTVDDGGRVGVGATAPGDYNDSADGLVVYRSGNGGITIAGTVNDYGCIYFADGTSGGATHAGSVTYNHATDKMTLGTAASDDVTIDSAGKVGIQEGSPSTTLHITDTRTAQLRLAYDGSNTCDWTVNSNGDLTISPSGGDLNLSANVTLGGQIYSYENKTSDGAISAAIPLSLLDSSGATCQTTLAAGATVGTYKTIICKARTNAVDVDATMTSAAGSSATITFTAAGGMISLLWTGAAWQILGYAGGTLS